MFNGFTQGAGDFLLGLTVNNERPWFEAHRQQYEKDLLTLQALAMDTLISCPPGIHMGLD